MFILNLVCRNQVLRETVLTNLKSVFKYMQCKRVAGEVNEIILIYPSSRPKDSKCDNAGKLSEDLRKDLNTLQDVLNPRSKKKKKTDVVKLTNQMDNLKLL